MKPFRIATLAATCVLAGSLSPLAIAQTAAPTDTSTPAPAPTDSSGVPVDTTDVPSTPAAPVESAPVAVTPPTAGPVTIKWNFRRIAGGLNLMVNPDGTYLFSGTAEGRRGKDFDIAMVLKSRTGGSIVFHFVGDANNGARWSKQGQSDILRDDWSSFTGPDRWTAHYHYFENAAGKRAEYEAREHRREELQKMVDDAIKRHDQKEAAAKKAELQQQQQQQAAQAQQQAAAPSSSGGSSIGSTLSTIGSVASTVLGFL